MRIFGGIDPGLSGAVAAVDERGRVITVQDTPTILVESTKSKKRRYVEPAMVGILENLVRLDGDLLIGIERVSAMPKQGVTSMFNMGMGYGLWLGILAALAISHQKIEPQVWKKAMGLRRAEKGVSVLKAIERWPKCGLTKDTEHGRADALLIAEHLRTTTLQAPR